MTTHYETREQALTRGIAYTGRRDLEIEDLRPIEGNINQLGLEVETEMFELENKNGITIRLAVQKLYYGWGLWLIAPDGAAVRT
jgi:hypothetical protein